jgi:hypothetical protein
MLYCWDARVAIEAAEGSGVFSSDNLLTLSLVGRRVDFDYL